MVVYGLSVCEYGNGKGSRRRVLRTALNCVQSMWLLSLVLLLRPVHNGVSLIA